MYSTCIMKFWRNLVTVLCGCFWSLHVVDANPRLSFLLALTSFIYNHKWWLKWFRHKFIWWAPISSQVLVLMYSFDNDTVTFNELQWNHCRTILKFDIAVSGFYTPIQIHWTCFHSMVLQSRNMQYIQIILTVHTVLYLYSREIGLLIFLWIGQSLMDFDVIRSYFNACIQYSKVVFSCHIKSSFVYMYTCDTCIVISLCECMYFL